MVEGSTNDFTLFRQLFGWGPAWAVGRSGGGWEAFATTSLLARTAIAR